MDIGANMLFETPEEFLQYLEKLHAIKYIDLIKLSFNDYARLQAFFQTNFNAEAYTVRAQGSLSTGTLILSFDNETSYTPGESHTDVTSYTVVTAKPGILPMIRPIHKGEE